MPPVPLVKSLFAPPERTIPQIDAAVAAGELEELGFYGWGTWVGRWHRAGAREPAAT